MLSGFRMASRTFTWHTIELTLKMALRALQILVNAFEMEIAVCVIESCHTVQTIMAINAAITELQNVRQYKVTLRANMAART